MNGKEKRTMISVIIPHLNQPDALSRCLDSLKIQTYPADCFEVIVIDNGSGVLPYGVLARFPDYRLAFEDQPGPGPARNRGVALARGRILAFIDADCLAGRGWLAAVARRLSIAQDRMILGGDVRIAFEDPDRLTSLEAYESVFAYRQKEYIERQGFSGTGNLAVTRRDFEIVGPFGGIDQAEDRVWGKRAGALGCRIVYEPGMIVYHPARKSFDELALKWRRHICHDYDEWREQGRGGAAWFLRSLVVAASGIVDARKVIRSDRISGLAARSQAFFMLARVRLYRAFMMMQILFFSGTAADWLSWNRPAQTR